VRPLATLVRLAHAEWGAPALAWLSSELAFHACGGRFDGSELWSSWQFLDPVLLQTRLAESLLYLHAQPPGFNALLGLTLELAPAAWPSVFALLFALLSLSLLIVLSKLLGLFGARGTGRFVALLVFALSPAFMLYGHSLFYTQVEALLLAGAALALARTQSGQRPFVAFALYCASLTALALTRAAYHLGFVLVSVALGVLAARRAGIRRARLAGPALACVALVSSVYVKNWVLFDQFASSSWLGMNLAKLVMPHVPDARLRELADRGEISRVALLEPFLPLAAYEPLPPLPAALADIPALSARHKRDGHDNMNHLAYAALSRTLLHDSVTLIRLEPQAYVRGVRRALAMYLESNGQCLGLEGNVRALERWRALYEPLVYGRSARARDSSRFVYPLLSLGIAITTLLLLWLVATRAGSREQRWLLGFMAWSVVYVGAVSIALDLGENARFRYAVDPLYLVAACAAWRLLAHPQARHAPTLARQGG
jgi:hypothetical protein